MPIDNCIEINWAEGEVEKWMAKQIVCCLRRGDDDRYSWYEQRTWESYIRRRFYGTQIYRASKKLNGFVGERGEH